MDILSAVLISLPVFVIIIAGWVFRRAKLVNDVWVNVLNAFSYYVGLPALIIISFWNIDFIAEAARELMAESILTMVGIIVVSLVIVALLPISPKKKASLFLVATTGNTIYMGFPIMASVFGGQTLALGTLAATIYLILPLLASIFVVGWWSSHDHSILHQLKKFAMNPLVIASVIGVGVSFLPSSGAVVDVLQQTLALLAATASPVALFAMGAFLYKRFMRRDVAWVIGVSLFKVAVIPLALFGLGMLGISLYWEALLVVLAAMPAAVTTFIIAQQFKLDEVIVCNALIVSTILSFFAIPAFIILLS